MKKFVVPLQVFAALFLCSGMAWMIFVLASINPVPPTANDLQARNTQDLSFVDMNSTAVALAREMLAGVAPSPSGRVFLPVTGKESATPMLDAAVTLKAVFTQMMTATPYYITLTPTRGRQNQGPAATNTSVPTRTLHPATATRAPSTKPPTQTALPPTGTPTDIPTRPPTTEPTHTSVPLPTSTDPPPDTPRPTDPPAPTSTPVPVVVTEPPTQSTP